jgi:Putative zinc-finger
MSDCEKFEDRFVDALYGELDPAIQQPMDEHLRQCSPCRDLFASMQKTLDIMDGREHPELPNEYWNQYDQKLQKRLADAKPQNVRWHSFGKIPGWALKAAAAFILVGVGVLIGRYYLTPTTQPQISNSRPAPSTTVHRVSMDPETERFLERSQVLLIGVVNLEPDAEGNYPTELSAQKKVSRDLIQEASVIKTKLKGPDKRRLNELVSDLELILLQIANLEGENDQPEVDMVKSGVDRKGVLFKINLEQMRMSGAANRAPEHKQQSGEKKL